MYSIEHQIILEQCKCLNKNKIMQTNVTKIISNWQLFLVCVEGWLCYKLSGSSWNDCYCLKCSRCQPLQRSSKKNSCNKTERCWTSHSGRQTMASRWNIAKPWCKILSDQVTDVKISFHFADMNIFTHHAPQISDIHFILCKIVVSIL